MVELFERTAARVIGQGPNSPTCSERTAKRWRAGDVNPDSLSPETRRVLEAAFGHPVSALFAPAPDSPAPAFDLEHELDMTAREAQDAASATAAFSLSDTALEQSADDVMALARQYATMPPLQAFHRGRALQTQLHELRDRTQVPVQQQRILELLGQTTALLAAAAFDLGSFDSSRRLVRAADMWAESARCEPLRAYCDGVLAYLAYFQGMPGEAVAKARRAQTYGGLGDVARRRLLAIEARALGYLGDVEAAQEAVRLSEDVDTGQRDDLHDVVGGEFGFTPERLAMSSSSTALLAHDANLAERSAMRALDLIEQRPVAQRSAHVLGGAAADLAMARLLANDLDGAADAMTPLWTIPADQRVTGVLARTGQIQHHLTRPAVRGAQTARDLRAQVEEFTRTATAHQLTGPALLQLEA